MKVGIHINKLLSLILLVSGFFSLASAQSNWVDGTLITFNPNGTWCWYQDERAVVDVPNNKLIIASNRTSNGHNYVDIYNISTGTTQNYDLGSIGSDDHNTPGIIIRPDGKYLAMYAQHYDPYNSRYRIFNGTTWATEQTFDWRLRPNWLDYTIAYSNLYYLSAENRMYNFARANHRAPNFLISTNQGNTWSWGGQLTTNTSNSYNKGYYKYWGNGVDRIDFIFTEQHPRDTSTSIYHGYIKNGKAYRSDGIVADENIFDTTFVPAFWNFTKVFGDNTIINGNAMRRCWNTDLVRYNDGTIATIITARINDNQGGGSTSIDPDHSFIYCRFNGSTWSYTYLGQAGKKLYASEQDYTGLAAVHPNDPNTIFISSTYNPSTNALLSKHEIFKGVTTNNGANWTWTPITKNSTMDNLRPIVPAWDDTHTALIWFRGTYSSAQNINAKVVGIITDAPLPVELTSFDAKVSGSNVELNWNTATEINNYGFDVERLSNETWETISFVNGYGNSNSPKSYSYTDKNPLPGEKVNYRLKQIDNDGTFNYSDIVEVTINPVKFALQQNYPNPFNPTTTIKYSIPAETDVTIRLFDMLGEEVKTLISSRHTPGNYEVVLNSGNLASGTYFYRIQAGDFSESKKLVILK